MTFFFSVHRLWTTRILIFYADFPFLRSGDREEREVEEDDEEELVDDEEEVRFRRGLLLFLLERSLLLDFESERDRRSDFMDE